MRITLETEYMIELIYTKDGVKKEHEFFENFIQHKEFINNLLIDNKARILETNIKIYHK